MYRLRACLLIASCIFAPRTEGASASAHPNMMRNTHGHLSRAFQVAPSNTSNFNSKPGGATPTAAPQQAPISGNSAFQSKAAGQPATFNPAPQGTATSTAISTTTSTTSVPATMAPPPMSPLLASLVQARNHTCSLADRYAALDNAMKEISTLPSDQQAAYLELANASRQRLVVDEYLFNIGQVQPSVPAKAK